jgi:hypothetical protein
MVPIHPVVLEKKFVLHISHRVAILTYVPRQGSNQIIVTFYPIGYPIWLPGAIIASDWLKFQRSFSPIGGHLGFSIGPKSNNTWLAACNDHS